MEDLDLGMDKKKKKSKKADEEGAARKIVSSGNWAAPTELGENDIYPYADVLQRVYDALSVNSPSASPSISKPPQPPPAPKLVKISCGNP